jgi:hypothetical protein
LNRTRAPASARRETRMRVQYAMRVVCEIEGESLEPVRNFQARESVRVSLALKFVDAMKTGTRALSKPAVAGSIHVVSHTFRCTFCSSRASRANGHHSLFVDAVSTPTWWNGRHANPRSRWRKRCRFDSGERTSFFHRATVRAGVAEKVNATLKRDEGKPKRLRG